MSPLLLPFAAVLALLGLGQGRIQDAAGVQHRPGGLAVRAAPGGGELLTATDATRTVVLDDEHVSAGVGVVALVAREVVDGRRRLRLLDGALAPLAETSIAADRHALAGRRAVAILPRAEHEALTKLAVEFLDALGRPTGALEQADRRLLSLEALADGGWAAIVVDPRGGQYVQRVDASGSFQWERALDTDGQPVVATSPDGTLTVIGSTDQTAVRSRLVLLDDAGAVRAETTVPHFHLACFAPDGRTLALLGGESVALVDAGDGAELWRRWSDGRHAPGAALAFSEGGRELVTVARRVDEHGQPGELVVSRHRALGAQPTVRSYDLGFVPAADMPVVELAHVQGSGWRLVTRAGSWTLGR